MNAIKEKDDIECRSCVFFSENALYLGGGMKYWFERGSGLRKEIGLEHVVH